MPPKMAYAVVLGWPRTTSFTGREKGQVRGATLQKISPGPVARRSTGRPNPQFKDSTPPPGAPTGSSLSPAEPRGAARPRCGQSGRARGGGEPTAGLPPLDKCGRCHPRQGLLRAMVEGRPGPHRQPGIKIGPRRGGAGEGGKGAPLTPQLRVGQYHAGPERRDPGGHCTGTPHPSQDTPPSRTHQAAARLPPGCRGGRAYTGATQGGPHPRSSATRSAGPHPGLRCVSLGRHHHPARVSAARWCSRCYSGASWGCMDNEDAEGPKPPPRDLAADGAEASFREQDGVATGRPRRWSEALRQAAPPRVPAGQPRQGSRRPFQAPAARCQQRRTGIPSVSPGWCRIEVR